MDECLERIQSRVNLQCQSGVLIEYKELPLYSSRSTECSLHIVHSIIIIAVNMSCRFSPETGNKQSAVKKKEMLLVSSACFLHGRSAVWISI